MSLEGGHPVAHDADAAFDGGALAGAEVVRDFDHARHLIDERAFGVRSGGREERGEGGGEGRGRVLAGDDGDEEVAEVLLLVGVERDLVLDGVGGAAEQVGVGDRGAEAFRELGDGQRERA